MPLRMPNTLTAGDVLRVLVEIETFALGLLAHPVVDQDECGHRLDDRHGAWYDARVMAAAAHELGLVALFVYRFLVLDDRGRGFKGDTEDEFFAVTDAPLDAAGAVSGGADFAALVDKDIVMLGAPLERAVEAAADLEALGRREREHGFGQISFQAVEDRHTQTDGEVADAAFHDTAHGVALLTHSFDAFNHLFGGSRMGAAHGAGLDLLHTGEVVERRHFDIVHAGDIGCNVDIAGQLKDFFRDRSSGDATDGLPRGGAATAFVVADAELRLVGEVRVRRAELILHLRVGGGTLVGIRHVDGDGRAEGLALVDTRDDAGAVALLAGCGDVALPGTAAIELELYLFNLQRQAGWATVDDDADAPTVAFTPSGNTKKCAKRITHTKCMQRAQAIKSMPPYALKFLMCLAI